VDAAGHANKQHKQHQQHQHRNEHETSIPGASSRGSHHRGGGLRVEVLKGGSNTTGSGDCDAVVSPSAVSHDSDGVYEQLQQWQEQHRGYPLGQQFQRHQLLQQLLQEQPLSAVMYAAAHDPLSPGRQHQQQQQQQQPVHVRLTHKRTAHGHEEVRVSQGHGHTDNSTGPGSPQEPQQRQRRQSDQQLQLVRQEQQWMHHTQQQQQQQRLPWEQNINQLDMNVLRPPAGFTHLSGHGLPHYVLAHDALQQPQDQQQGADGSISSSIVPAGAGQVDRYAPHPGLLAHLQGRAPMVPRHPALGWQPR
jgi:hypothetical protein